MRLKECLRATLREMAVTCLAIGDPHFKRDNVLQTDQLTRSLIQYAEEVKPTFIVCLGDVEDRFSTIYSSPNERATKFLEELRRRAPLYVLIGNHDLPNPDSFLTTEHPFYALHFWENTRVSDRGIDARIRGLRFLFMPYVYPGRFYEALSVLLRVEEEYWERVRSVDAAVESGAVPENEAEYAELLAMWKRHLPGREQEAERRARRESLFRERVVPLFRPLLSDVTAIFSHQEWFRCRNGAEPSHVGDYWPLDFPPMISGHIHDHARLQPNLVYTGVPMQHNFGEPDGRTVSLFSFLEGGGWTEERRNLRVARKIILSVPVAELSSFRLPDEYSRDLVKVEVSGTPAELKAAEKCSAWLRLREQGVRVAAQPIYGESSASTVREMPALVELKTYHQRMAEVLAEAPDLAALWREKILQR